MGANLLATISYLDLRRLVRFEKEEQGKLDFGHKMRLSGAAFVATLVIIAEASPQGINFGGSAAARRRRRTSRTGTTGSRALLRSSSTRTSSAAVFPSNSSASRTNILHKGTILLERV